VKECIACDFDKTLSFYVDGMKELGKPLTPMLRRIKAHLAKGDDVEIFTARASSAAEIGRIQDWTEKHLGVRLPVTNVKKSHFTRYYDDRAEGVVPNTGRLHRESPPARRRLRLSR